MSGDAPQEPLGPVEIEVRVKWPRGGETDVVTCPREEWEAMTAPERTAWCEGAAEEHASNHVRWGFDVFGRDVEDLG